MKLQGEPHAILASTARRVELLAANATVRRAEEANERMLQS
jgi:hypothetical protein